MSLRETLVQKYVRLLSSVKVKLKILRISSTYRLKVVTGSGYYVGQYFMTKLSNVFWKCLMKYYVFLVDNAGKARNSAF